jgi:hemolysin activation/secretion protein
MSEGRQAVVRCLLQLNPYHPSAFKSMARILRVPAGYALPAAVACFTALLASSAVAAPPDAGQLLNEQQQLQPQPLDRLPQAAPEQEKFTTPAPGSVTVRIHSIQVTGAGDMAEESELQAQVADAIGSDLGYTGLQQLADRITLFLRNKGYLLAFAYLPAQDLDQGQLEIAVQAGRLDSKADGSGIELRADGVRIKPEILRNTLAATVLQEGDETAARVNYLERGLLLLNDLPGITARSTLEPGSTPGTSRLVVHAEDGHLLRATLSADNHGNRYSGERRVQGQLTLNNPGRIGDQANLTWAHAQDINQAVLSYRLPIGRQGLQIGAALGFLDYGIGEELEILEAKGTAFTARVNVSYPVIRSRQRNLWSTFSYEYRHLKDEILQVRIHDKVVDALTLGVNGNMQDGLGEGGLSFFTASITNGRLDLSRHDAHLLADEASARTHGGYTKINFGLGRLQQITHNLTFYGALSAQAASGNLDSSEKFILGGPAGIRAYPAGEASGDSGWLANLELRYELPRPAGVTGLQLVGFVDGGGVRLHRHPWPDAVTNINNANRYDLAGAGIGLNIGLPAGISVRTGLAAPLGSNPGRSSAGNNSDGRTDNYRFWLQILAIF